MGNQLAQPQKVQQDYLADIPYIVYKEHLGGGRFLKSVLCVHDKGGQVVVKVYHKRGDVDLDKYGHQLVHIRTRLSELPSSHVWPFQHFFSTEKAAYLIRQHLFSNLYHRLSTRPFLASIEKHWIVFQLLHAVAQSHEQGICHGDIKCENVLVTSWHWIFLADFASYKPAFLPADNPADFSFFFDTGGRRRCYIAPERFYASDLPDADSLADAPLRPSMDIFSLGCVIAELFLEGQRLFDLSELLAYKRGDYDPSPTLAKVEEPFRDLVKQMILVDPGARLSASEYLQRLGPKLFPFYFDTLLHPFLCSLLPLDADNRIAAVQKEFPKIVETILGPEIAQRLHDRTPVTPAPPDSSESRGGGGEDASNAAVEQAGRVTPGREAVRKLGTDAAQLLSGLRNPGQPPPPPPPPPTGTGAAAGKAEAAKASSGRMAVIEEAFEFECRDKGRAFGNPSTTGTIVAYKEWSPPRGQRKEDVALPAEAGWQWTDEWRIDRECPTDARGWAYRMPGPSGEAAWSAKCKLECLWRRRRWTRQRRKLHSLTQSAFQGGEVPISADSSGNVHGLVIVATLLCSTMRGARRQESKVKAISLLTETAKYCDDDTRLQRIVPYLVECMKVPLAIVRHAALQGLVEVLGLIESLPPSDAKVFAEYILPSLSRIPNDEEEWMRVAYAAAIGPLATVAIKFLDGVQTSGPSTSDSLVKYEAEARDVRGKVEKVVKEMMEGVRSTSSTKRALLSEVDALAAFLGARGSNNFLLPMLMTILNSPDWQLRTSFFTSANSLARYAGPAGIEAYLLPCLLQALGDRQDAVIAEALALLSGMIDAGWVRRRSLLAVLAADSARVYQILPTLLSHSCAGVRAGAVRFAAAAARQLSPAEAYVFLQPKLSPVTTGSPTSLGDEAALAATLPNHRPAEPSPPHADRASESRKADKAGNAPAGPRQERQPGGGPAESAPLYSISLDPEQQRRRPQASFMSLAAQLAERSQVQGAGGSGSQGLLALARRKQKSTADMVGGRLQLGGEEALSFQVDPWGPSPSESAVHGAMDAAIHTSLPAFSFGTGAARDGTPWRPRGVLVTHLVEHKRAVNRIAVAGNGAFFVTASDDQTSKVWDCRSLERDVTFHSRLTYSSQGGRITACTSCEESQSVATASSDGSLHVWRVEYIPRPGGNPERYTGTSVKQEANSGEGAVLEVQRWDPLLVYCTQSGTIHGLDLRSKTDAWTLQAKPSQGLWGSLALDSEGSNWLVAGSSRGNIALWDMRYQMCVNSWQLKDRPPILALAPAVATPRRLGLSRFGSTSPLIYVSSATPEIGLWDVQMGRCHQVLKTDTTSMGVGDGSRRQGEQKKDALYGTDEVQRDATASQQGSRALLPTGAGALLTGSSDACIRCWEGARHEESYMVCGPPRPVDRTTAGALRSDTTYGQRLANGRHYIEEQQLFQSAGAGEAATSERLKQRALAAERQAAVSHADSVLHMSALHNFGERLLLSASADGVVKAWK